MDDLDLSVRRLTYGLFVELGRAPSLNDVATAATLTPAETLSAWRRLHDQHAIVLEPSGTALRMANPFSAVETSHRVRAAGRWWYANCAWDSFGICAALGVEGQIETICPDCGNAIHVEDRNGRPSDESLLFHCLVPASSWWNDITFT